MLDIGLLTAAAAGFILQLDLGKYLGSQKLFEIVEIAGIVGCLQADEIQLGLTQKALDVKTGRDGGVRHIARGGRQRLETQRHIACRRQVAVSASRCWPGEEAPEDEDCGADEKHQQQNVGKTFAESEVRQQGG